MEKKEESNDNPEITTVFPQPEVVILQENGRQIQIQSSIKDGETLAGFAYHLLQVMKEDKGKEEVPYIN